MTSAGLSSGQIGPWPIFWDEWSVVQERIEIMNSLSTWSPPAHPLSIAQDADPRTGDSCLCPVGTLDEAVGLHICSL